MNNSPLASYVHLSNKHSGQRTHTIDRITPHCYVGLASVETMGKLFADNPRKVSANYGIGADGRIGMYVPEGYRSWCSSSAANDQRAVTIECASGTDDPYAFPDVVYDSLIELCADICRRNGKTRLVWIPDKAKALKYSPAPGEMLITLHKWFANKACPGRWLIGLMDDLCDAVNVMLEPATGKDLYRVQVGSFRSRANAEKYLKEIQAAGYPDAFITTIKNYF